jgi:phosphoribosyl-ATP pyrophosphohydrolase
MTDSNTDIEILQRLYTVVESRKDSDAESSYTASLLRAGIPKIAQKLGEEAVETVIAATTGDDKELIGESADLLYHLLVIWVAKGITLDDVWAELSRREGTSGIAEKASRKS